MLLPAGVGGALGDEHAVFRPALQAKPAGQSKQLELIALDHRPGGHIVQLRDPAEATLPAGQAIGADPGSEQEWPAGHSEQGVCELFIT